MRRTGHLENNTLLASNLIRDWLLDWVRRAVRSRPQSSRERRWEDIRKLATAANRLPEEGVKPRK